MVTPCSCSWVVAVTVIGEIKESCKHSVSDKSVPDWHNSIHREVNFCKWVKGSQSEG